MVYTVHEPAATLNTSSGLTLTHFSEYFLPLLIATAQHKSTKIGHRLLTLCQTLPVYVWNVCRKGRVLQN